MSKLSLSLALIATATGFTSACSGAPRSSVAHRATATAAARSSTSPFVRFHAMSSDDNVAEPTRLRIPAIGVTTSLDHLGITADGAVAVPRRAGVAGWFEHGPRPGQDGPAVVLGHVDSRTGPAVFYALRNLRRGAAVNVDRADGTTMRFRVNRLARYPKSRFPTAAVYYPTLRPELRLVTCSGTIDPRTGHYRDNLVVFATAE